MQPRKTIWFVPVFLCVIVASLWVFPKFWYKKSPAQDLNWFHEQSEIKNCQYVPVPVSETAEKLLVADSTFSGEFVLPDKRTIRAFSTKRYQEKENEIGLFMHTPDRCWTEVGWQVELVEPETVAVRLNGLPVPFERRIFHNQSHRELVYFGGLVGGKPLPYRLDHNLSIAIRSRAGKDQAVRTTTLRASDAHFWKRLWDSFVSREELSGPKQFIRISTPIDVEDVKAADESLQDFLPRWLVAGDYNSERKQWELASQEKATGQK